MKKDTKPKSEPKLEPMGDVDITIPKFPKKPITLPGGQVVHVATETGCHDVIRKTLAEDKVTPNGFLPEHIRNMLRAVITKTD